MTLRMACSPAAEGACAASRQRITPITTRCVRAVRGVVTTRVLPVDSVDQLTTVAAVSVGMFPGGTNQMAAVGGLSALAVSFVGTFGVLPRFKEALREPESWKEQYDYLVSRGGVPSVTSDVAAAKARKGALVVDVRIEQKFTDFHAKGSLSVPLYRPIQAWDLPSNLRRAAFAFFGIFGTELNPDFMDAAREALPKNKEIFLVCENGGSLANKPGVTTGFQSRSLKAAAFLMRAGYSKVSYVEGGISGWARADLPTVSK